MLSLTIMNQEGNTSMHAIAAIVIIAIVVGVFYFMNSATTDNQTTDIPVVGEPSNEEMVHDDKAMEGDKMMEGEDAEEAMEMKTSGAKYVQYSEDGYETIADQRHVLYFYANWCPTCRPADAEFQREMSSIPDGLTVVRVNYEDDDTDAAEEALANQHNITYQHTFLLIENGEVITRWNGGSIDELLSQVQ